MPLCRNKPASILVSLHAHLPSGLRLIGDTLSGNTRPALFSDTGGIVPLTTTRGTSPVGVEINPSLGVISGGGVPQHSLTPDSSPSIRRSGWSNFSHRRKVSNEGLERKERASSSLMDSLNLDHPLLDARSNSSTLPSLVGRSSPVSGSSQKVNSLRRSKKPKGSGYQKRTGLDLDDVVFGLDKRASVRSDPGDRERREKGKFGRGLKSHASGSSYTSPTSSIISVAADTSQPINIPHHSHHMGDREISASLKQGSESVGKGQAPTRNTNSQSKGVKGRSAITKLNISLPTGPLYKEVVQSPKKVKVVGEFRFEYSGGEGAVDGYYREAEASVTVSVCPCLLFKQFDISNTDK